MEEIAAPLIINDTNELRGLLYYTAEDWSYRLTSILHKLMGDKSSSTFAFLRIYKCMCGEDYSRKTFSHILCHKFDFVWTTTETMKRPFTLNNSPLKQCRHRRSLYFSESMRGGLHHDYFLTHSFRIRKRRPPKTQHTIYSVLLFRSAVATTPP